MKKLCKQILVSVFAVISLSSFAQLAVWNPTNLANYGPSPWAPTGSNSDLNVGGMTRGDSVLTSGSGVNNGWGGHGWTGGPGRDITFTFTPKPGFIASVSSFSVFYRRSATGASVGTLEYAVNNGTYNLLGNFSFTSTSSSGSAHTPINLTSIANLQNIPAGTPVKFRIVPGGATSLSGTFYIYGTGAMLSGTTTAFDATVTSSSPISCFGQANGALSASVSGGSTPYTYSWAPSNQTTQVAGNLAAGVYTVFIRSANNLTTVKSFTLGQPAVLQSSVSALKNIDCLGGTTGAATVAPFGGTPPYNYTWSPGGGNNPGTQNLTGGTYSISIMDANNCSTSQTVLITQGNATIVPVSTSTAVCSGNSVAINVTGANTYTFTGGISQNTPFTPTVTDSYTVSGTDLSGCTGSAVISIPVHPLPMVQVANSETTVCAGQPFTLTASGASTYTWNNGDSTLALTFTGQSLGIYSYTVTGSDTNGCSAKAFVSVTVNICQSVAVWLFDETPLIVFPQPSEGKVNIKGTKGAAFAVITIEGRVIKEGILDRETGEAQLEYLLPGMYFVRLPEIKTTTRVLITR